MLYPMHYSVSIAFQALKLDCYPVFWFTSFLMMLRQGKHTFHQLASIYIYAVTQVILWLQYIHLQN